MTSVIRQLLDEISWEGNARKYRGGGIGKENVLTAEVFQLLDLLPRSSFLLPVLHGARGASEELGDRVAGDASSLSVLVLPGDLTTDDLQVRVQPDVLLVSDSTFVMVEAKAVRRASFQPEQLGRELLVCRDRAEGRRAVLLLVLGEPPPVRVKGSGLMPLEDALTLSLRYLEQDSVRDCSSDGVEVLWTTWASISQRVSASLDEFTNPDPSVLASVRRMGEMLREAIEVHS